LFLSCCFLACTGRKLQTESPQAGKLQITFDNVVGNRDLILGTEFYTNTLNQTFKVANFNYYVSNIKLQRADGTEHVVLQDSSYFLVRESNASSQTAALNQVPFGEYTGLTFILGVDSLRNTMDIAKRTGVLDPATGGQGHYWTWNSGYIFMRLEGNSPQSTGTAGLIQYHVGGFGGYSTPIDNNIKKISLSFGTQKAVVQANKKTSIQLRADALKIITGIYTIDFATLPNVMGGDDAKKVAENASKIFEFVGITNGL